MENAAPKKRFEKRSFDYDPNYTPRRFKRPKYTSAPSWYNRRFFLHLSLRQYPKTPAPRGEIVQGAFDLNHKIGKKLNLPFLYGGKVPYGAASNLLSQIANTSWVQYKEPHKRTSYFSLRDETYKLEDMATTYQHWCRQLAANDWKVHFAPPTRIEDNNNAPTNQPNSQPVIMEEVEINENTPTSQMHSQPVTIETDPTHSQPVTMEKEINNNELDPPRMTEKEEVNDNYSDCTESVGAPPEHVERFYGSAFHKDASTPQFTRLSEAVKLLENFTQPRIDPERLRIIDRLPIPSFEQPLQWSDIMKVTDKGVFAIRKIPGNIPIGFYFGAPMTEDEYDALKYREGWSAEFCLMYRSTVLDATDDRGEPITDITNGSFCPFHFMNETDQASANVVLEESKLQYQVVCWTRREIQPEEELRAWFGSV